MTSHRTDKDLLGGTIVVAETPGESDWDFGYVERQGNRWIATAFEQRLPGTFATKRDAVAATLAQFTHITCKAI